MNAQRMNRRKFLKKTVLMAIGANAAAAGVVGCIKIADPDPRTIRLDISLSDYSALASINGGVKITVPGQTHPVLVTRTTPTTVAAFSSRCTHLGCDVDLPQSTGAITCPCHGSTYLIDGRVIKGPAKSDLTSFPATISGNIVTISI
jgi:Rieske Fe-S protein